MPSLHITPIEVYRAIRTIVKDMQSAELAAAGKQPNSFAIIRSEADLSGDTLSNSQNAYLRELYYSRTRAAGGDMFADFPRVVLQEFNAGALDGGSSFDIALMCADKYDDSTPDANDLKARHFKEVEEDTRAILLNIYSALLQWEKRVSPDGTQVHFAPASQMTGTFASWRVRDTMQQVLRSTDRLQFRRTIDGLFSETTAGNVVNLTMNIRNFNCVEVTYANPCSGSSSFELDVNGETVTVTSETYTLEVLQDGVLIGTVTLGEDSGTVVIPVPDPVNIDVNGVGLQAEAGENVNVQVLQNGVEVGTVAVSGLDVTVTIPVPDPCEDATVTVNEAEFASIASGDLLDIAVVNSLNTPVTVDITEAPKIILFDTLVRANGVELPDVVAGELVNFSVRNEANTNVGAYLNDHHWQIRNADLLLNGTVVDELMPETNKALTVTLNGASTTPTYTAGTINVTTVAPSGYVGLPLDVPAQIGTVVNTADVASAFIAGAFNRSIPTAYIDYQRLDSADPLGVTLLYNSRLFGTKNRFTNIAGTANTFSTVNWLDGAGVTRTARCMIDHLYDVCLFLTGDTGRWSVEWPTRLNGATYSGTNLYPVSRGMLDDLVRYDVTFRNHVDAYMGHSGLLYSGEVPSSSTTSVFSLNGNALGTVGRSTALKVLLFHQIP